MQFLADMLCAGHLLSSPTRTHRETLQNTVASSTVKGEKLKNVYLTIRDWRSFFTVSSVPNFLCQSHNYFPLFSSKVLNFTLINSQTSPNNVNNVIKKLRNGGGHATALLPNTPNPSRSQSFDLPMLPPFNWWNFCCKTRYEKKTWPLVNIFFNRSLFDIGNIFWFGEDAVHSIHIYLYLTTTVAFMDIF